MTIEKLELEKEKYSKELKSYYNYLKESEKDVKKLKTHIEFLEYMIRKIDEFECEIKGEK